MNPIKSWTIESFGPGRLEKLKGTTNRTSGSDNTGLCVYTYNELGFRGDNLNKDGFKIMSLGCSHTEGVGVNDHETWPSVFSSMVPNGVNYNFGTGGRSNDFISRCLLTYYDLIKPDLVLILYTYLNRRDYYDERGGINPFSGAEPWGFFDSTEEGKILQESMILIQNTNENIVNWYKNHLLIKNFLELKKCNWIWDNTFINVDYSDENLFNKGFGSLFLDKGADGGHPGKKHHQEYARKLTNFILMSRSQYLPKDMKGYFKKSII